MLGQGWTGLGKLGQWQLDFWPIFAQLLQKRTWELSFQLALRKFMFYED